MRSKDFKQKRNKNNFLKKKGPEKIENFDHSFSYLEKIK